MSMQDPNNIDNQRAAIEQAHHAYADLHIDEYCDRVSAVRDLTARFDHQACSHDNFDRSAYMCMGDLTGNIELAHYLGAGVLSAKFVRLHFQPGPLRTVADELLKLVPKALNALYADPAKEIADSKHPAYKAACVAQSLRQQLYQWGGEMQTAREDGMFKRMQTRRPVTDRA